MNPTKKNFGRITINGERISLGATNPAEIFQRAAHQYLKAKAKSGINVAILEISDDALPDESILDVESKLLHEFNSLGTKFDDIPDDEESYIPGISQKRLLIAFENPLCQAYRNYAAFPDKRIGVAPEVIQAAKAAWFEADPEVAAHFPPWSES